MFHGARAFCHHRVETSFPVSELKPLLYSLHDSVMLLAPVGWTNIDLVFIRTEGVLCLTELRSTGQGSRQPGTSAQLLVDLKQEARRLGEALTELESRLNGKWVPGTVRVERPSGAFADWKLLRADESVAWFSRLEASELHSLLITDALHHAVRGTERAFHQLQSQVQSSIGSVTEFAFDADRAMLRLRQGDAFVELQAQVVGSYLLDVFTWVWSWSEDDTVSTGSAHVRRICQPDLKADGLAAFWRPHFHCDEGFSWALAGHVAVSLGARGLFRGVVPDANAAVFFAVMSLPNQA